MKVVVVLLLVCLFVVPVFGVEVTVDKYDYGAQVVSDIYPVQTTHPSATTFDSAIGMCFVPLWSEVNITSVSLWLKQSSASGNVSLRIEGMTGVYGSTGVPNGTVLAQSGEFVVTSWVGYTNVNFTFSSPLVLSSPEYLCWYLYGVSGDVTSVYIACDNAVPLNHAGNPFLYENSAWASATVYDFCFVVYGDVNADNVVVFSYNGDIFINEGDTYEVGGGSGTSDLSLSLGDLGAGTVFGFSVLLVEFLLSLFFVVRPLARKGIINFLVGFIGLIVTLVWIVDSAVQGSYYLSVFGVLVALVNVYCVLRADGISKISSR